MSFFSTLHCEGDGAVDSLRAAAFCKCKQEVHHLPYLSQLGDPLAKLVRIRLIALDGHVAGIDRHPPENPIGLQQLPRHQVGEVRRPELRGGRDGEASHLRQPHRPALEPEGLFGEVQPVHGLVWQQQTFAILPLLASLLQRLNPQAHHLRQLVVRPEGQLQLRRHAWSAHRGRLRGRYQRQGWIKSTASSLSSFCPVTPTLCSRLQACSLCLCSIDKRGWILNRYGGKGARQQEPMTYATTAQGFPSGNSD